MYRCIRKSRHANSGFSLLETIMAISLAALLMSPVLGMLRTCRGLFVQMQDDAGHADCLHSTLRHITRNLRSATAVTFVESGTGRSAELRILNSNGQVCGWKHDLRNESVLYSEANEAGLLAENISQLKLDAFDESGLPTKDLLSIRMIRCTATTQLKKSSNAIRSATCTVWIRPTI